MITAAQVALMKKDIRGITSNKRLLSVLLIVPLVMTVALPSIFVLTIVFVPEGAGDFRALLKLMNYDVRQGGLEQAVISLIINNIMPVFFLLIPIMASSVMAASSFVGEKEKRTLETLLYCPLSLKQIFSAKILASFILSMAVSILSFLVMMVVVETEMWFVMGELILPNISWLVLMLLVSPAISIIAITLIVRGSAKAQTVEESQQRSVFLILPVILLAVGQFTGIMMVSVWLLLGIGALMAVIACLLMRASFGGFNYETLLK